MTGLRTTSDRTLKTECASCGARLARRGRVWRTLERVGFEKAKAGPWALEVRRCACGGRMVEKRSVEDFALELALLGAEEAWTAAARALLEELRAKRRAVTHERESLSNSPDHQPESTEKTP